MDNQQIDIRDVSIEKVKSAKTHTVSWLKRYGYWAMIIVLFVLGIFLSLITIGDVYQRTDLTEEEVYQKYISSGHIMTERDMIIVKDIIMEAYSKDEVIDFNEYERFVKNIQTYNYEEVRFDSLSFYIYTKEAQEFINFRTLSKWRIMLVAVNSILGILATITFMQTGIQDALNTKKLKDGKKDLTQASMDASKYRLKGEEYFSKLYKNQLESVRRNELSVAGLIYEDYFDKDGRYIEGKYAEPIQNVLNEALKLRVVQLSFDVLATSITANNKDVNNFNGINQYKSKVARKSIIMKTISIIFVSFISISLIVSAQSAYQAFMNIISIILMFTAGFLEYLNAYAYIIDDYSETLSSKERHLRSFISWCELPKASVISDEQIKVKGGGSPSEL